VGASVLQHYGRYQTISDLRLIAEPGREGLSMRQVRDLLVEEGMEVKAFRAPSSDGGFQFSRKHRGNAPD